MDAATFIIQAGYGDTDAVLEALAVDPELARARNDAGVSVIATTIYAGRLELARKIARHRENLDLFEAACLGDKERVTALLAQDPKSLDQVAPDGFTAIGFAAYFGHLELLRDLLARGADFERPAQNPMRVRPLHSAAAHSDPARAIVLARVLLEAGADPNAPQEGGMRPLHEAVYNANAPLVDLLVDFGANPHLPNEKGETPLQLARARSEPGIATSLEGVPID